MPKTISLFSVLFLLAFSSMYAQNRTIQLKQYTSENGLSDNQVTCVLRDKLGFMWIGTKDGLNRYDGREFYKFRHSNENNFSICGNNITCLETDNDSVLWIGTASTGFCSYDFRTGKFTAYHVSKLDSSAQNVNAIVYNEAKNELIIAIAGINVFAFDLKTKSIEKEVKSENGKNTSSLDVITYNNKIYVASISQYVRKVNDYIIPNYTRSEGIHSLNKIIAGKNNTVWAGAWENTLHEIDTNCTLRNKFFFERPDGLNFSGDEIISLALDRSSILWCGTKLSGIHFFDTENKRFLNNINLSTPLRARINCLYTDNVGRMWIGSDVGLSVYDPLLNQFEKVILPVPDSAYSCKVNGRIITDGGKEYVITACGLFYKNTSEAKYSFKDFFYKGENLQLTSIFQASDKTIYVGSSKTLHILDTLKNELRLIPLNKDFQNDFFFSIFSSRISSINEVVLQNQLAIMAIAYGHYYYLYLNKSHTVLRINPAGKRNGKTIGDHLIRQVYVDPKNNIWLCGALNGISKLSFDDNLLSNNFQEGICPYDNFHSQFWNKTNSQLGANDVYDVVQNGSNDYWITTQGGGLLLFNPADNVRPFKQIDNNYQTLQGIAKSDYNYLWIIASTGLLQYNVEANRFTLYNKSNGIPEGLSGYFFSNSSTEIAAGFNGGFISFNPEKIIKDNEKPLVSVSKLWIMDSESDSLLFSELKLKHDKNFIKFYISSNCFSNNEQVTYYYRLSGIDKEWRRNENNPLITYTNLPPGNFVLEYKAENSDGVVSDIKSLRLIIIPPFTQTWYFYLLMVMLLVALIYTIYRIRLNQVLKLQAVRNKIARDLHDDIGSTLGSINLFSQVAGLKLNQKNIQEIMPILEKIGASSREIIDKTGDAVWAVNPANDTVKNLFMRMEVYAAELLGTAGISFNIKCDDILLDTSLDMTQRKNIFLIYKESIHNIIKYSAASEVNIVLSKHIRKINLLIKDNGKGFNENGPAAYNGNGLKNMKERATEIGGDLKINSSGNGVAVELSF